MMNKYQLVLEALSDTSFYESNVSDVLYHASSVQNLKKIVCAKGKTKNEKVGIGIYATPDKTYASAFTFQWRDSDGINMGRINKGPWIIQIPTSYKKVLAKQPCSIYTISIKNFHDMSTQTGTPEWFSSHYDVPVLSEEKYKSVLECFKKNNLVVRWV